MVKDGMLIKSLPTGTLHQPATSREHTLVTKLFSGAPLQRGGCARQATTLRYALATTVLLFAICPFIVKSCPLLDKNYFGMSLCRIVCLLLFLFFVIVYARLPDKDNTRGELSNRNEF